MKISSLSDLEKIANNIKKAVLPGDSIFLYGEIGVGKTTFARMLINNYELENKIKKSGKHHALTTTENHRLSNHTETITARPHRKQHHQQYTHITHP